MNLSEMQLKAFLRELSSDSPAPGGGSAAALFGAVGAGLTAMVACLTQGRKKYADLAPYAAEVESQSKALLAKLQDIMDRDTEAFNAVSAAFALPKETEEQKALRSAAIQDGLKACTATPLECMELCAQAVSLTAAFLSAGFNPCSASDLGVAFLSLKAAMQGAWLNVLINLSSIRDEAFILESRSHGERLLAEALPRAEAGYDQILAMIGKENA